VALGDRNGIEHLRAVNWGLHCKVMRLLSLGTSRVSEIPGQNMMQRMVGRVAAGVAAAVRDRIFEHANELCTSGRRVDGALLLQQAIDLGRYHVFFKRAFKRAPLKWGRFEEGLPLLSGRVLGRFAPLEWAGFRLGSQEGKTRPL
jgi:hypothetical protein